MTERRRVAAVIVRDGCVMMVRERGLRRTGRHDGPECAVEGQVMVATPLFAAEV
ncbi:MULTISPECIES: hypothetical protein [Streptomyces]|uniref:hypothetical protein n=1 Tax=Streptomyces TaxID=1883 RepID=UPI000A867BE8|nr:hypothetical protein [Streptomyces sp. NRRL S-237]